MQVVDLHHGPAGPVGHVVHVEQVLPPQHRARDTREQVAVDIAFHGGMDGLEIGRGGHGIVLRESKI